MSPPATLDAEGDVRSVSWSPTAGRTDEVLAYLANQRDSAGWNELTSARLLRIAATVR